MQDGNRVTFAAALAAACLLAAGAGNAQTKTFHATLNAQQEVPPTDSKGTGTGEFKFDPATKQLSWTISYSGLSGPAGAAHIHGPAAAGANAGVEVNLSPNGAPANPITGTATLTDAQVADLTSGKDYVNIHTAANKGGEIRGQITP
ncbi:MAG TPA: CHRD domain-containing protein [Stellaceae bacterium]|nr:CHRD domain-containing protein [Stellaceae bacterium]